MSDTSICHDNLGLYEDLIEYIEKLVYSTRVKDFGPSFFNEINGKNSRVSAGCPEIPITRECPLIVKQITVGCWAWWLHLCLCALSLIDIVKALGYDVSLYYEPILWAVLWLSLQKVFLFKLVISNQYTGLYVWAAIVEEEPILAVLRADMTPFTELIIVCYSQDIILIADILCCSPICILISWLLSARYGVELEHSGDCTTKSTGE